MDGCYLKWDAAEHKGRQMFAVCDESIEAERHVLKWWMPVSKQISSRTAFYQHRRGFQKMCECTRTAKA